MSTPAEITVRDLRCRLGGVTVLDGIDFEVQSGEFLSIIGPNGAGKSTLLRCMNGILRDWQGSIEAGGVDIRRSAQREIARVFAYVPQFQGGRTSFEVNEFLMLSRYARLGPLSTPGKRDWEAVRHAMALTDTESLQSRRMDTLSGGESQKVAIAAALAQESPILLLDEPITFLDPRYQHDVNALLKRLNRERKLTIVSVSHDINSAVLSSHRVLGLKQGRIAFLGDVETLMSPEILAAIFDTDFLFAAHPESGIPLVVPRH